MYNILAIVNILLIKLLEIILKLSSFIHIDFFIDLDNLLSIGKNILTLSSIGIYIPPKQQKLKIKHRIQSCDSYLIIKPFKIVMK